MQNPNSPLHTEYKVRPVVRYLVTRFEPFWSPEENIGGCNSSQKLCEVESEDAAEEIVRLLNATESARVEAILTESATRYIGAPVDLKPHFKAVEDVYEKHLNNRNG